jgi:hypothetical protein
LNPDLPIAHCYFKFQHRDLNNRVIPVSYQEKVVAKFKEELQIMINNAKSLDKVKPVIEKDAKIKAETD